jgi:hypothetical protein
MVTDAVFADIEGDDRKELVVVGEWMEPKIFSLSNGRPVEIKTSLSAMKGWWQSIAVTDIDGDNLNDLVLGNIGENCYLQPSTVNPVKLWINDFDGNGTSDKIITRTIHTRDVPVFMKRDLTDQMPGLKKQNLKFVEYAKKSVQELFSDVLINKASVYNFTYNASCLAINKGKGNFEVKKLPLFTQLSSINAILITDINNDGKKDMIVGGNLFQFQPQFSRLDASYGQVLINKGKAELELVMPQRSGIEVRGEVKSIICFQSKEKKQILFLQNDSLPVLYRLNK